MTQATTKLSMVAGAALMLGAFPAFAQTNTQPGAMNEGTSNTSQYNSSGSSMGQNPGMAPRSGMNTGGGNSSASNAYQGTDQTMSPHRRMHSGRTDTSQNAAVDSLNERSLQAAQQGQNFMPGSSGGTSTMPTNDSMGSNGNGMHSSGGMNQPNSGMSNQGAGNGKM